MIWEEADVITIKYTVSVMGMKLKPRPHPWSVDKLSSMKLVSGATEVGGHCNRALFKSVNDAAVSYFILNPKLSFVWRFDFLPFCPVHVSLGSPWLSTDWFGFKDDSVYNNIQHLEKFFASKN